MRFAPILPSLLPAALGAAALLSGCVSPYEHEHRERQDVVVREPVVVRREPVVVEPAPTPPPVPHRVLETAEREGNGRTIESVRLVRREGRDMYLVHMTAPGKDDITFRIEPDGDLRGIERFER